jgi:phage terminase large subunit-like protein
MQTDDKGRWLSSVVTIVVGRQAGKTRLAALRIVTGLTVLGEKMILHSAQNLAVARITFDEVVDMLESTPELAVLVEKVVRRSGFEAVIMRNGAEYRVLAGKPSSWRGWSKVDLIVFDEAREQTSMDLWSASRYTARVADNPQTWVLSTAGTDDSVMLRSLVDRGLRAVADPASDPGMVYLEWSAPYDLPIDEPSTWAYSNPTLGEALRVEQVRDELRAEEDNLTGFRRECLSQWISSVGDPVVSVEDWQACVEQLDGFTPGDRLDFAFDLDPEHMRATIICAGHKDGRLMTAPVMQFSEGVSEQKLAAELEKLIKVWRPGRLGYDPKVAGGVAARLEGTSVELVKVTGNDFYAACGRFHDTVKSGLLAHPADPALSQDVCSNAVRKYLGDEVWVPQRVNKRRSYVGLAALIRAVWLAEQDDGDAWFLV